MKGSIGPHEGRELELMLSGQKPLSMFLERVPPEFESFPEEKFDRHVAEGRLIKHVSFEQMPLAPSGEMGEVRRIFYALPDETWRIKAFLLVDEIYRPLMPGWRADLERVIGRLLGYDGADIEKFVEARCG